MAFVYSTAQTYAPSTNVSGGDISMSVNVFRGDCTRTEKKVTFKFGVSFSPNGEYVSSGGTGTSTTNSIAAWYDGEQRFAQASSGNIRASKGNTYYATYTDRSSERQNTTEKTCFTYTSGTISATTTKVTVTIGVGWNDWAGTQKTTLKFSVKIPEYHGDGTTTKPVIKDTNDNKFTIKGSTKAGVNNAFKSAKVYYTTDGTTPTTSSSYKSVSEVGSYTITLSVPTTKTSTTSTIKAFTVAKFEENTATSAYADAVAVKYHKAGTAPTTPTITDNGNNKFTISGTVGKNGTNAAHKKTVLYYTTNGNTPATGDEGDANGTNKITVAEATSSDDKSGDTYSKTYSIPSGSSSTTVKAFARSTFDWGDPLVSSTKSTAVLHHTAIGSPKISITDNGDNTFTITGTAASNGTHNNTATTSYAWGYSTAYGTSGTGKKTLDINTPSNATRTVCAKATAVPSWSGDSTKTATASLAVKQYVAPGAPGKPTLSYSKSRLTVKENWTFSWSAAAATNTSSPVKGYRIALLKNGTSIPIKNTSGTTISSNPSSADWHSYDTTKTSIVIDPVKNGFAPGDKVKIGVKPYTHNGKSAQVFASSYTYSTEATVKNAGVMRVKVSGSWKEGIVYVKSGGSWKEADIVYVKAGGSWKESE